MSTTIYRLSDPEVPEARRALDVDRTTPLNLAVAAEKLSDVPDHLISQQQAELVDELRSRRMRCDLSSGYVRALEQQGVDLDHLVPGTCWAVAKVTGDGYRVALLEADGSWCRIDDGVLS